MSYLLDTSVVTEVRKPSCDPAVRAWFASVRGDDLFLSALVVGEIRLGVERLRRRDPARVRIYEEWLGRLERDYADRILPIDAEVADEWGRLDVLDPLPVVDGLIAATARVHDLTLITRNVADVARSGVRLLNPFDAPGE